MAVTLTSNKGYSQVTVGTESGTWGPYINGNVGIIDNNLGGVATIAVNNSPVTLSSAQYQCAFIRFTGAITADIAITFPAVGSFYTIINDTTNSSNFNLTALTTAAGGRVIGIPPGNMTDILTDGTNARYRGLPPVGTYLTVALSSLPRWISACTVAPYLNCDGNTFSAATFPALAATLGSTTLPDTRGRVLAALNQGTGRLGFLVDGNTIFDGSDDDALTIGAGNLPSLSHAHAMQYNQSAQHEGTGAVFNAVHSLGAAGANASQQTDSTDPGGSDDPFPVVQPTLIAGITLIRAG